MVERDATEGRLAHPLCDARATILKDGDVNSKAVDAILATNPRYAGAGFYKPETDGGFIPIPNNGMVRIQQDARINAAKAIVAERLVEAADYYINRLSNMACNIRVADFEEAKVGYETALAAWRELTGCSS